MLITLEGNPTSTQTLYGINCRGSFPTRYMTAKGKDRKEAYQWEAKRQWKGDPTEKDIEVVVKLYFNNKGKHDIDNFSKILYDALTGIVWEDDSQIKKATTEMLYDKLNPRITIEIL